MMSIVAWPKDGAEREPATVAGVVICRHGYIELYCYCCEEVQRAINAERERCAGIAGRYYEWHKPEVKEWCDGDPAGDIAARIRSGE